MPMPEPKLHIELDMQIKLIDVDTDVVLKHRQGLLARQRALRTNPFLDFLSKKYPPKPSLAEWFEQSDYAKRPYGPSATR